VLRGLGNRHLKLGFAAFVLERIEVALPLAQGRYLAGGTVTISTAIIRTNARLTEVFKLPSVSRQ